jgi:hypothetical protein
MSAIFGRYARGRGGKYANTGTATAPLAPAALNP